MESAQSAREKKGPDGMIDFVGMDLDRRADDIERDEHGAPDGRRIVYLTEAQRAYASERARRVYESKVGKPDQDGKERVSEAKKLHYRMVGERGEYAAHLHWRQDYESKPSRPDKKTGDIVINGHSLEIRCTDQFPGELIVTTYNVYHTPWRRIVLVLERPSSGGGYFYVIAGWVYGYEGERCGKQRRYRPSSTAWYVPQGKLRPMPTLWKDTESGVKRRVMEDR